MKKLIFAFAVVLFSAAGTQAQTTKIGLKAGATGSNINISGIEDEGSPDMKIGFYAGILSDIGISESFSVAPELFYSQMGAKESEDGDKSKLDLGYINLPVLLKYKTLGLSVFLGPQISYLISAKSKFNSETEDVKDGYDKTDISGVIGAGYTLMNGFGFDARYQVGLTDIIKESGEGKLKNNAIMVGIHYYFSR